MANNEQNDKELNVYLGGNSDLSKSYRASNREEPSVRLDNAILSSAKEAVKNTAQTEKTVFHKSRWTLPVSIAAMVTLSVSLVITMQQEAGQPLISEPEVEMFIATPTVEEGGMPETTKTATSSNDGIVVMDKLERQDKKDETSGVAAEVPATPAVLGAVGGYRALLKEEKAKAKAPKARLKQAPAKKMLSKEKAEKEVLEEKVFPDNKILHSAPIGVDSDNVMNMERDRKFSYQEGALAKDYSQEESYVNNWFNSFVSSKTNGEYGYNIKWSELCGNPHSINGIGYLHEDGQRTSYAFLGYCKDNFIDKGIGVIPPLILWAQHEKAYVRYVAIDALRTILKDVLDNKNGFSVPAMHTPDSREYNKIIEAAHKFVKDNKLELNK